MRDRNRARLVGLKRGGPQPPATRSGAPLRPLTIPNLVGYIRIGLIAAFLVLALSSDDGRDAGAFWCFGIAAATDYLDGFLARATSQYSRLGTLMDPLIDRLLVISGVLVAWHFELLPRWALAALVAREALMLIVVSAGLRAGLDLEINWIGRLAVWPTMAALGLSLVTGGWLVDGLLYLGLTGALLASALYLRDGYQQVRNPHRKAAPLLPNRSI